MMIEVPQELAVNGHDSKGIAAIRHVEVPVVSKASIALCLRLTIREELLTDGSYKTAEVALVVGCQAIEDIPEAWVILTELPKEAVPLTTLDLAMLGGIAVGLEVIEPIPHRDLSAHEKLLRVRRYGYIGTVYRRLPLASIDSSQEGV